MRPHACLIAWLLLPTLPVAAQAPSAPTPQSAQTGLSRNAAAVSEGRAALDAFQLQDWERAYTLFQRAELLAHSPVFVLYMARAKRKLGALLEADRLYSAVLNEPTPKTPIVAWQEAQDAARTEQAALRTKIPSVRVLLEGGSKLDTTVTLNGAQLEHFDSELALDPGVHVFIAQRAGALPVRRSVTLREGEQGVLVHLTPLPALAPTLAQPAPPKQAATMPVRVAAKETPPAAASPLAAYIVGAAGITSLLVTAVAGSWAWSESEKLKNKCNGTRCDIADQPDAEAINRLATIADVSFLVGITGLGVSATLFWVLPDSNTVTTVRGVSFTATY